MGRWLRWDWGDGILVPRVSLTEDAVRWLLRRSGILARVSLSEIVVTQPGFPSVRVRNRLFDAGELLVVRTVWRGEAVLPTAFWGMLANDVPSDTDTLADIQGEPTGNGYARIAWTRDTTDFGSAQTVGGVAQTIGVKKTFTATGAGYGPVNAFVFATTQDNTGVPFAWFPLSQDRTVTVDAPLGIQPYGLIRGVAS